MKNLRTSKTTRRKILRRERRAHHAFLSQAFPDSRLPRDRGRDIDQALQLDSEPLYSLPVTSREEYLKAPIHRDRNDVLNPFIKHALVFQQLNKNEVDKIPAARLAREKEWKSLRKNNAG